MKKKSRKELEGIVKNMESKLASYNVLFGLYVRFKGDSLLFQEYLKKELRKNNG